MSLEELAKHLSDTARIGLNEELAKKLGIAGPDATRGRLLAQQEGVRGHLQVLFLGCYVVDDTDFFGDGEIYWWSIPALLDKEGKATKGTLYGVPNGMAPHKCGDQEWMTNLPLADPPLLGVIPPGPDVSAFVVHLGIYDDDRDPADLPGAITAGMNALVGLPDAPMTGSEPLISPVRDAIYEHLKAQDDDILIDQALAIRKGEVSRFGAGIIGSSINAMVRAYYFVMDTSRTQRFGPVTLHKGQMEHVRFDEPIEQGGRIAMFARGHDVDCPSFGQLTVDQPFINRVVEHRREDDLKNGFQVMGQGPAKFVAYYTPSYAADED